MRFSQRQRLFAVNREINVKSDNIAQQLLNHGLIDQIIVRQQYTGAAKIRPQALFCLGSRYFDQHRTIARCFRLRKFE